MRKAWFLTTADNSHRQGKPLWTLAEIKYAVRFIRIFHPILKLRLERIG